MHHSYAPLREVATEHRSPRCSDVRDSGCRYGTLEWSRLWGEVHLHSEGSTSGRRVWNPRQDTSWEVLTQKPRLETLPQLNRGKQDLPLHICEIFAIHKTHVQQLFTFSETAGFLRHSNILPSIPGREALDMLLSNLSLSFLLCVHWGEDRDNSSLGTQPEDEMISSYLKFPLCRSSRKSHHKVNLRHDGT